MSKGKNSKAQLSNQTLVHHVRLLKMLFRWAVEREWLDASPVATLKPPTVDPVHIRVPTREEILALLEACPEEDRLLVRTIATYGLRVGEAIGLPIDAVDVKHGTVHIRQAAQVNEKGAVLLGQPKTRLANRVLPLPHGLPGRHGPGPACGGPGPHCGLDCHRHLGRPRCARSQHRPT
jgi:site-specific recombinase XerD